MVANKINRMPIKTIYKSATPPEVSVIIPSWDGDRDGNVQRLVEQVQAQSDRPIEVILVIAESPNGRARNLGAEVAQGDILVFIDDDVRFAEGKVLEQLIEPLLCRSDVGLTGVSQFIPPDANWFQRMSVSQVPRSQSPLVDELTDSDMVTTMCLAIPRELFDAIGGMNDRLIAGVDPELRHRVRQAGYRVAVVPQAWAYHPIPDSLPKLVRYAFKKGGFTAWQYRFARDLMYDCPEDHVGDFREKTSLPFRVLRKCVRMLSEVVRLRLLGVVYDCSYSLGYIYGLVRRWG